MGVRPATDADADAFIAIVSRCWNEYPGCVTDIHGEAPELLAPASALAAKGGAVWAAEADGGTVGLIACWPVDGGAWEIGKMYLDASCRGGGVASDLLATAEAHMRAGGASRAALWSDTRFCRAHAFYEKHSYMRTGPLRALDDKSQSIEFGYAKPLRDVEVVTLDTAGLDSVAVPLARVLVACVADNASVSFMAPLDPGHATAFWRDRAREVARGTRVVLAAWLDGRIVGVVALDFDTPENQAHRADLQKLLVHPAARRRSVGRALMRAAEAAARGAGRTLLTLDTGSEAAVALYRDLGWTEAGRIPGYALNPDGTPCDTLLFWKRLVA